MNAFEITAEYYDSINGGQYAPYACFLEKALAEYAKIPVREMLDLGCGTGGITSLLAARGYDMVGADSSPDMLSAAMERGTDGILYICQDMRSLELYGTVQAAYSSFDCLNYLSDAAELDRVFSLLRNYIEHGGLLVFDVNTRYRYENIFARNSYVYELGEDMLVWQNRYSPSKKSCTFFLTLFRAQKGAYQRYDEVQKQRFFPTKTLLSLLKKNRFSVVEVFGSVQLTPLEKTSEKAYFIAIAE